MKQKYDDMCLVVRKEVVVKESTQWFNAEIKSAINARRQKEKKWCQLHTELSRQEYSESRNNVNRIIRRRKYNFFRQKIKEECVFPSCKKLAIVKPILMGNLDSQNLSLYRPVSNLSFLSKIIENVIFDQIMEYLGKTNVFPDNQSAFIRLYSIETALCNVVNSLVLCTDEGRCGVLVLLDLSAAFDTVVHELLLDDLRAIGVTHRALRYIRSYLEDRKYCVQIGNSFSDIKMLRRVVPQGSVPGPMLLCIYTIELSYLLQEHGVAFTLYADDTQFYLSINNILDTESKLTRIV